MICDLIKFTCGNTIWTYTSGPDELSVSPHIYEPIAIERGDIDVSQGKGECTITMPLNKEPASMFALFNPPGVLWVEITRYPAMHKLFIGKVAKAEMLASDGKISLQAVALQAVLAGDIPNETFATSCEYDVFDSKCGLSASAWVVLLTTGSYSFPSPLTLQAATLAGYANGYFNNGFVASGMESSFIVAHAGINVTLMYPLQTYAQQSYLAVYPGCDKKPGTCRNKFGNEVNFGGCPFIPAVNYSTEGW